MSSMTISWIFFGMAFGGALLGMALRALLPAHHLSEESKDVVKLGMGLIGAIAALVLGLLVTSAKSSFDAQTNGLAQLATNLTLMDRILAHYGPETKDIREELRELVAALIHQIRAEDRDHGEQVEPTTVSERLYDGIQGLSPKTEAQRSLQAAALASAIDVAKTRWLLSAQRVSSIPTAFLVILTFWIAILFASFSLCARPNLTVVVSLLFCALSVAGAIFLILEMDRPYSGIIRLSSDPLRRALAQLGR